MRKDFLLLAVVVGNVLIGCGKTESLDPKAMNAEQEKKFQEDERKAAAEEQRHQAERGNNGR